VTERVLGTVMVHVDDGPNARTRVEAALALANQTQARLIGIASAQPALPVYAPFADGLVTVHPEVLQAAEAQIGRTVRDAKSVYDDIVGASHPNAEWRSSVNRPAEDFLNEQSRAADLVIVGRRGAADSLDPILGVEPADIIMGAGRPVLVTPPQIRRVLAKRILVAWKDAREARRAVYDALPLMRLAGDVFVVSVGPEANQESAADAAAALQRANINARTLVEDIGRQAPGEALVEIARRAGADLIVAGAFGHSRMREWVFGGVTRHLLDRAPMCCLFSH
jgi:nucleotide-binding universal stress UspA family protein